MITLDCEIRVFWDVNPCGLLIPCLVQKLMLSRLVVNRRYRQV
jgi:hypothetical protein